MEEMKEKKNIKGIIWLIVILIILMLGITGFIIYDKFFVESKNKYENNNSTATDTEKVDLTGKFNIPKNLSDYSLLYWNYDEIYNYYFKMNATDTKINIDTLFKDVKIDNNKLYWNIDNQWISDKKITDDIIYFNMNISPLNSEYFIAVTSTNKIYYITFEEVCFYCKDEGDTSTNYKTLTTVLYDKFKYNEIVADGKISKVSAKVFKECEVWNEYYFEINNKVYVLNTSDYKMENLNTFMKNRTITELGVTCSAGYEMPLIIEKDATIKGMIDENNNLIKVKHYILLEKEEDDFYDIVIDNNDYLYIIDRESKYQKISDRVLNFKYEKDDYGNEKLEIDLDKNNNITKEISKN